jgi:tight adherence protein C
MWIWMSMCWAGLSLCLLAWWLGRPFLRVDGMVETARNLPMRCLWPWIDALAPVCRRFMSWRMRRRLERLLHGAGRHAPWTPHHLCAFQLTVGLGLSAAAFVLVLRMFSFSVALCLAMGLGTVGAAWPVQQLRERIARRRRAISRAFPFLLDMVTLCVEAGLNLHGALQQAAQHGPAGPLRDELRHMLSDIRAGMTRQEALEQWVGRCELPALNHFVAAVAQADQSGMSLGPVLRAQSDQRRNERFQLAEKLAMEAPVKMMFPLVLCIFPCTFLIIAFPIASRFLDLAA